MKFEIISMLTPSHLKMFHHVVSTVDTYMKHTAFVDALKLPQLSHLQYQYPIRRIISNDKSSAVTKIKLFWCFFKYFNFLWTSRWRFVIIFVGFAFDSMSPSISRCAVFVKFRLSPS